MPLTFKRTRLAPTPSGFLHLGNVFSFAVTTVLAKRYGASILLRIDDLDRERVNADYVDNIFETLQFMGIPWNEGPRNPAEFEALYSQRHRIAAYEAALFQLSERGLIYACTCSRTQILAEDPKGTYSGKCRHKNIPLNTPNACWRLFTNGETVLSVKELHGNITNTHLPKDMQDFIVRRRDGLPAYQLSSLVDDVNYEVDLIIRGQDLWHSTLAQMYLAQLLGKKSFLDAHFYHHPLLTDPTERKLSKSAGDTSIRYLRGEGLSPELIYSRIAQQLCFEDNIHSWQDFEVFIK